MKPLMSRFKAVLAVLSDTPMDERMIARKAQVGGESLARRLKNAQNYATELVHMGLATRHGPKGYPGTWTITDDGRQRLGTESLTGQATATRTRQGESQAGAGRH